MPSASEDTAEIDAADLVEEADVVVSDMKAPAAPAKPVAEARRSTPSATFPEADALIHEARRRAQLSGQVGDRLVLARARTELAILLEVLKGDTVAALAEYRAAHAIAPTALAPIAAARRLTPLRPIAPALALLEAELRATTDQKTRGARLLELGRMLLAGGAAPEKSVQAFRDVLAIVPDDPAALRGLERALRALPRALENPPTLELLAAHLDTMSGAWRADRRLSAWLQVERASILERLRKPEAARAALELGLELDGGVGPVREAYTRHLLAHDHAKLLVQNWSAEAWLEGDSARAARLLYSSARLSCERLTKPAQAIELFRRAIALSAASPATRLAALRELERLHSEAGDLEQMVAVDRDLLPLLQGAELTHRHRRLAQSLEKLEKWEEVARHAEEVLSREGDDEETRERFDRALSLLNRHEQRISFWTAEASRVAMPAARLEALLRAAQIAEVDLARPDVALIELRAAWAIDPDNTDVADAIARLLTPTSPPSLADPADPARARARIDFYTEAAAKTLDPGRKLAHLEKLAQLWEDEVRAPEKAMETYRDILAIDPDRRSAILGLERTAARAGDPRLLFRALTLEAESAKDPTLVRTLLLRAAEVASAKLNDADTALDLVERILMKSAGDPAALRASCRIHQRTGRFEEAAAQLRVLLQHTRKGPASFAVAVELGTLLDQKLRRRDEAIAAYRDAFRNDPSHPLPKAEIRRILLATGDHRLAAEELVSLSAAAPDPAARGRLLLEAAEIHSDRLNDAERAVTLLVQARALLPGDIDVKERLERAYHRLGKTGELALLLDGARTTSQDAFTLGWLLSEDRDWVRANRVLEGVLAQDAAHLPSQRALEHSLTRTEQWSALDAVLRAQARTLETKEGRLGALSELVYLEEYRGVAPATGAAPASELIRAVAAEDLLAHEAVLKLGLVGESTAAVAPLIRSVSAVAESTRDPHHAAALELIAALLLERTAQEHDEQPKRQAIARYRAALEGWPECLTAARGLFRLGTRLDDDDAFVEGSAALGTLAIEPKERADRLIDAAERLAGRGSDPKRAEALFARALGENPEAPAAAAGLIALAETSSDVGFVVDALRRALERTMQPEQAIRLGGGLASLAFGKLKDPTVGLEALKRVRKRAPGHVPTLLRLCEASLQLSLFAEAAETAQSALGISRDTEERLKALFLLATAHAKGPETRKDARREVEQIEKAIEGAPLRIRPRWLVRLGDLYLALGDRAESERMVIAALVAGAAARAANSAAEDNAPLEALERLHPVASRDGAVASFRAIEEALRRAKGMSAPPDPSLVAALGRIEVTQLGRPRDGLQKIREAIRLDPARVESYATLCEIYASMGSHEDAVEDLLSILPTAASRSLPLARALPVLELLGRTCQLAARSAQTTAVRQAVSYLSGALNVGPGSAAGFPGPMSLAKPALVDLLAPAGAWQPWLELCGILAEVAPKVLRTDPVALGVSARERLPPRAAHPLRALCDQLAPAFGERRFDLFVDAAAIGVPRVLPTEPALLVLPRGYSDLPPNEQAAGIGRLLAHVALDVAWLEDLRDGELAGWLFGAMRVGSESWQSGKLSPAQEADVETWRGRIAKVVSRKHKRALEDLAARADRIVDPELLRAAVRAASLRAAFLVTGDLGSTLNHLARIDRGLSQLSRGALLERLFAEPAARDLIFFSLTREALSLRKSITASAA